MMSGNKFSRTVLNMSDNSKANVGDGNAKRKVFMVIGILTFLAVVGAVIGILFGFNIVLNNTGSLPSGRLCVNHVQSNH